MRNCRQPHAPSRFLRIAIFAIAASAPAAQAPDLEAEGSADLLLADWILAGEREDFDWELDIENPSLQMDQRFEIPITARVEAGDLAASDADHELTFAAVVTDLEGSWLAVSDPEERTLTADIHEESAIEFEAWVAVIPGRYLVWAMLYDRTTGELNVSREEKEADSIGNDPLPVAYRDFPPAEFAAVEHAAGARVRVYGSDLAIPINSPRPLQLEILAVLSVPEQWPGGEAFSRHVANMLGAVSALSQIDPAGADPAPVTGLDLLRREIAFEHDGAKPLDVLALAEGLDRVNRSAISLDALLRRSENPAFLRQQVEGWLASAESGPEESLRVLILIAGVMRFEDDPDLSEVRVGDECNCRIYHLRFRQIAADLFDQVDDILDPLDPETFDILTPRDFRNVIGEILSDLER